MNTSFLNEAYCYNLLKKYGVKVPRHAFITSVQAPGLVFKEGEDIVLKAVVDDVWHKSDVGLLEFSSFSMENINRAFKTFKNQNPQKENWRGMLVCEKVSPVKSPLPAEILLSIKHDPSCGPVITMGFGGIHTELWGRELKDGVFSFPSELTTVQEAMDEISNHLLGKILLGGLRQGKALVSTDTFEKLLKAAWNLADHLRQEQLDLIEINPLVVDNSGNFIALDAVGRRREDTRVSSALNQDMASSGLPREALFNPQTFIVAGVSSHKKAFGNLILDNFSSSDIPRKNIRVLKPNSNGFEEYETLDALNNLKEPVDVLILAVPARAAIGLIDEACKNSAVRLIYLVAGGIGDSADTDGLKERLQNILSAYPPQQRPRVIGPNSLGIILSRQRINTLFIPREKLPVTFYPHGNIGLIAQSGAFFITRISRNPALPIRDGFCIGNQLDISATEILQSMANETELKVIGLYLEGPPQGNALALARVVKQISPMKKIIVYRAGRSSAGMKAAAGHTGALASEYGLEKRLLQNAGAIVCESFSLFENNLCWYSAYPEFDKNKKHPVSVMTNAGYESVACADGLGALLAPLTMQTRERLMSTLTKHKLRSIVSPANPLDLTPMASDDVYYECARDILQQDDNGLLIIGIVPLTAMINTVDEAVIDSNVKRLKKLIDDSANPVAVVVDAGTIYSKFKHAFRMHNIPLFASVQDVFEIIR